MTLKAYPRREYAVFIVSGMARNFSSCLRSILRAQPDLKPEDIIVHAGWPETETPEDLKGKFQYVTQYVPFTVTRENNRALRSIWGRGKDAILCEDDVEVLTTGCFARMALFAEVYDGRCLVQPGIHGFKYNNVVLNPRHDMEVHVEPKHYPIICTYFPQELELIVGYYDEMFNTYGCDDNDYSLRCQKAAVVQLCLPKLSVKHNYERSVFALKNARDQERSKAYFTRKWGHGPGA